MLTTFITIVLTSVLTAGLVFLSLRFVMGKIGSSISGLTSLGAKVAGTNSGFNRGSGAVSQEVAGKILNSPNLAGLKMIASQAGFDIDDMVEERGALQTLAGLQQVLGMLGVDVNQIMSEGLGSVVGNSLFGGGSGSSGSRKIGNLKYRER